jgi:GNAT superfamily N-acetyltransferase
MADPVFTGDVPRATLDMAVAENLYALFRAMAGLRDGELEERKGFSRHHVFPSNPMYKGMWKCRLSSDEIAVLADETIAWFRERKAPYFFWWVDPATLLDGLGATLVARGLIDMEGQTRALASGIIQKAEGAPCMSMRLSDIDPARAVGKDKAFTIVQARNEADLHDFAKVFVETYQIPAWAAQGWIDATLAFGTAKAPWRILVGRLHGQPVATAISFCGAGVASIYGVAVLPEAQGRGLGMAITARPFLDAKDEGYEHGVLFSSERGLPAYEGLGFRKTGGTSTAICGAPETL